MFTPQFKSFLVILSACLIFVLANRCRAENIITVTPYFSLGLYHRDCALTDPMICDNDAFGSDTPGTIDLGLRIEPEYPTIWLLYADEVDAGWHHQSYADRGWVIPGVLDFGGKESQIDMYGLRFTWLIKSMSFKF